MTPELLHVVTCCFNPLRYESRWRLYEAFERQMLASGVCLTTVECQLGHRPFVLQHPHVRHVQVRNQRVLFHGVPTPALPPQGVDRERGMMAMKGPLCTWHWFIATSSR